MARVTIEDCIKHIPNRFELVVLAAKRARALARGAESALPPGRDKNTVRSLREIGSGLLDLDELRTFEEVVEPEPEPVVEEKAEEASTEAKELLAEEATVAGVSEEAILEDAPVADAEEAQAEPVAAASSEEEVQAEPTADEPSADEPAADPASEEAI